MPITYEHLFTLGRYRLLQSGDVEAVKLFVLCLVPMVTIDYGENFGLFYKIFAIDVLQNVKMGIGEYSIRFSQMYFTEIYRLPFLCGYFIYYLSPEQLFLWRISFTKF